MAKSNKTDDSSTETVKPASADKPTLNQKRIKRLEKKAKILDLTEGGASIRQISERLIAQGWGGVSRANVGKMLKEALEDCAKELHLKTKHYVTLEINKMRRVELAHFARLLNATDPDHIEKLSRSLERVWKRQDSLLGLTKPEKMEHTGPGGGPIETVTRVIMPAAAEEEEPEA